MITDADFERAVRTAPDVFLGEERLQWIRDALDLATDLVVVTDAGDAVDPRITYANEEARREVGYESAALVGSSLRKLGGPATDENTWRKLFGALSNGENVRGGLTLYRSDGSWFWAEIEGSPVRDAAGVVHSWVLTCRNATLQKRERERSAILEDALDHASDQISIYDISGPDPVVAFANRATAAQLQLSRDEVLEGAGMRTITGDDSLARYRQACREGQPFSGRVYMRRPNGTTYWLDIAGRPIHVSEGEDPTHWIAIGRNIDETIRQEQLLIDTARMQHDLIAMLAHDMRSPLTVIGGYVEILREEFAPNAEASNALQGIEDAVGALVHLADDTLQAVVPPAEL